VPNIGWDRLTDYALREKARVGHGQEQKVTNLLDAKSNGVLNGRRPGNSDSDSVQKSREGPSLAHRVGDLAFGRAIDYDEKAWFVIEFDGPRRDAARNDGS
jgi:hypothetical protein